MTIKLPLTASDLVDAAKAQLNEESELIRERMIQDVLPRTLELVLENNPEAQKLLKSHKSVQVRDLIPEISQTLWSYPGSFGASRIGGAIYRAGFKPEEAEVITEAILNYTRYPLSIVNFMRHLGSSINSVENIFRGPRASETVYEELGYSRELMAKWNKSSIALSETTIKNEDTFTDWLFHVEEHLKVFLPVQARITRYLAGRDVPPLETRPRMSESALARAYTRRFGNFVSSHLGFSSINTRAEGAGTTAAAEFAKLLKVYSLSDAEIFSKLESEYENRSRRMSATLRKFPDQSRPSKTARSSGIEQSLNINGKKVEIRTSKTTLPSSLIEQFIKSFNLQYSLNPEQRVISTRLVSDGEFIELEVEKPEKTDLKKIQSFIESMYLG